MRTQTATLDSLGGEPLPAEVPHGLEPGRRLGPYELLLPIASGGMGHVWAAARLGEFGFRRKVAVKVMREELAQDGEFRRMFLDEARLASNVVHTNVVEVLDLGVADGVLYQAMALVDGASLSDLVAMHASVSREPVPVEVVVRVVLDVLRGLHAAHELRLEGGAEMSLVHRDVSPHNVLVGLDGVAKITDFGIAKASGSLDGPSRSGAKGKRSYMAPEQLLRQDVDRRADVFAVGVLLWELLAGARLADAGGRLLDGHPLEHPPLADARLGGLASIAMRALERAPEHRFGSAEQMAQALERAAQELSLVVSPATVAGWTAALVAERVERRNVDADARLALSSLDHTLHHPARGPAGTAVLPVVPAVSPRRRWIGALSVPAIALAIVGGDHLLRGRDVDPAAPLDPGAAATAAPSSDDDGPALPEPAPAVSGEPAPARVRAGGARRHASPRATPPSPPAARPPPPTASASALPAPSPRYDNPYGR